VVKPIPIIIASGILVLIGFVITIYQSQITSENFVNEQKSLSSGTQMTITKAMDLNNDRKGVYGIQVTDLKNDDNVKIIVIDPNRNAIITKFVTTSPIQEIFKISSSGNYTLQIENQGQREIQILGFIGYYPEGIESDETSGNIVPIMLIIGLAGLAVGIMYFIKNRAKPKS
jgi:lipopolysaccharide export LptBFGC system permease protein LptF